VSFTLLCYLDFVIVVTVIAVKS